MGLDESNTTLLQHGSIINVGGQYVRLVGDRLIVSRNWPGATSTPGRCSKEMLTPVEAEVEAALAKANAKKRAACYQALSPLFTPGSTLRVADWLNPVPLVLWPDALLHLNNRLGDEFKQIGDGHDENTVLRAVERAVALLDNAHRAGQLNEEAFKSQAADLRNHNYAQRLARLEALNAEQRALTIALAYRQEEEALS